MGFGYAWIAPTLAKLCNPSSVIPLTSEQCSWIASLNEIGRIFGALSALLLIDVVGRKPVILISSFLFFIQWIVIAFTHNVWIIYAVRLVFGVGIGISDISCSIYLGENSSPRVRGIFGSIIVTLLYAGRLIEYTIAAYFSHFATAKINAIIIFFTFLPAFVLRESPQFLLMTGKSKQAYDNFKWARGNKDTEDLKKEFASIQQNVEEEQRKKQSIPQLLNSPSNRRAFRIVIGLCLMTMLTGFSAVSAFASIAFVPSARFTSNEFTLLCGIGQLVGSGVSPFFMERFDRKPIMMFFFSFSGVAHAFSAGLYYVHENIVRIPNFPYLIFISITTYMSVFAAGVLPSFFLIRGELFSQSTKVLGGCCAIMGNSIMGTVTSRLFLVLKDHFGIYLNFLLYAVFSLLTAVYVYYYLPETRGRTLIEIQKCMAEKDCKKSVTM